MHKKMSTSTRGISGSLRARQLVWLWMGMLVLAGCVSKQAVTTQPDATGTVNVTSNGVLPSPEPQTTNVPDVQIAAQAYLQAWQNDDYSAMYAMLTSVSQDALDEEAFSSRYRQAEVVASVSSLEYEILSVLTNTQNGQVAYRITWHTVLVGDITRENTINLSLENGAWRVQWDEALILPELVGGNYLSMDYSIPARGNIYDRAGNPLVAQTDAISLGLIPGQVAPDQVDNLLNILWRLTGIPPETIRTKMEQYQADWYLPIGEVSLEAMDSIGASLYDFSGVVIRPFQSRYYFSGGIAPHVVGYVSLIQAEEAEQYQRQGYRVDERVGRMGLEKWGEQYLSGTRGGTLYVVSPDGLIVTKLAESVAQPAQDIYTTLDGDLQQQAQEAIQGFAGSIVVLERDTGRVLAMVSSPGFDPNAFEPSNYNSSSLLNELFSSSNLPLLNRPAQGQYPPGSTFKIITMATALESGLYTAKSTYNCGYFFTELQGLTLNDWTYDHFLKDDKTPPSGLLTLPEGLMRSCNPFFWHIGLDLYNQGLTSAVTDMAHDFGLGAATGIDQVAEAEGQVLEPENAVDAVNQAIGQGTMLVTPLQMARIMAAIGNGGSLLRPQVVEQVVDVDGQPLLTFKPEVTGTLPLSADNLAIIQNAMRQVVVNPRGTAAYRFRNFSIPVYGKTGTASVDGFLSPHAWFVGYTDAQREGQPDIAVVVMLENAGEGSDYAAPIFRRIVEIYFYGRPHALYPWESQVGVTSTPVPDMTETPTPTAEP